MPIVFDEVTAEIQPPPSAEPTRPPAPPAGADADFESRLNAALALQHERAARLSDD